MNKTIAINLAIIILSLLVWVSFYLISMPLTAQETILVVGLCAALVFSIRWISVWISKLSKGDEGDNKE